MVAKFEITEYYELVALHKAIHSARFSRKPLIPALPGSPYLADIAQRVVDTLAQMEIDRGKPERATDWQIEIDPNGEVWQIAVRNASQHPEFWNSQTLEQKIKQTKIFLSPFVYSDTIVEEFIQEVDSNVNR